MPHAWVSKVNNVRSSSSNNKVPQNDTIVNNNSIPAKTNDSLTDEKLIDGESVNGYNGDSANRPGELVNEFHKALTKTEWRVFYKQIADTGRLQYSRLGVKFNAVIGNKLVLSDRKSITHNTNDFVVTDVFMVDGDPIRSLLYELYEYVEKEGMWFDDESTGDILEKCIKSFEGYEEGGVLRRFDKVGFRFLNDHPDSREENRDVAENDRGRRNGAERGRGLLQDERSVHGDVLRYSAEVLTDEEDYSPIDWKDIPYSYDLLVAQARDGRNIFYDINLEVDGKVPRANRTSLIKSSTSKTNVPQSGTVVNSNSIPAKTNDSLTDEKLIDGYSIKDYNNRGWAMSLLHQEDIMLLNEKIKEAFIDKKDRFGTLSDGTYIFEVNNKLLYVSGTFKNPVIESVLYINADSVADVEIAKGLLNRERNYKKRTKNSISGFLETLEERVGPGFIRVYSRKDYTVSSSDSQNQRRAAPPEDFGSLGYYRDHQNRGGDWQGVGEENEQFSNEVLTDEEILSDEFFQKNICINPLITSTDYITDISQKIHRKSVYQ